ncbi:hypothetical protein [Paenibacillus popilliae]|uniref:hypothetical protein n=1 Tax=Paenibacillus popilliae TaxID=78057 RepID=UPI00131EED94|nr:hypothetical protein [Paenibacillus popilliae]
MMNSTSACEGDVTVVGYFPLVPLCVCEGDSGDWTQRFLFLPLFITLAQEK